jgi:LemA protein
MATAEAYPDLEAEERFQDLHEDLRRLEDTIALARQAYNLSVQAFNNAVQTVPTNIVAWIASFTAREFLSAPASDRDVPEVQLDLTAAAGR